MPRLLVAALAAVTIGTLINPSDVSAQPSGDEPAPTTTTVPVDPPQPAPVPVPTIPTVEDGPLPVGESLIPDAGVDDIPTRNYDIGYDAGAWNHLDRKGLGFLTNAGWMLNQIIVSIVLWFVGWAFDFDLIGPLAGTADQPGPLLTIAELWRTELILGARLDSLVWFIVASYVAFQVWRGRAMNALGELTLSIVALGVAIIIGANPAGYLDGAATTLRQVSGATLAISRGQPPSGDPSQAAQITDPLRAELHDVLIEQPHEIINWGGPLPEPCTTVNRTVLADGPWGSKDNPRTAMQLVGCDDQADFNHDPTFDRMASAWMATFVSCTVLVLLLVAVVTMMMASLFFILRFSWLFLALLGFQLPGAAREFAWGWLIGLIKNLGVVAAMSFVISYMLLIMSAFLTAPGMGLSQRFAVVVIVAISMFFYRKQILNAVAHLAERLRNELGAFRPGLAGRGAGGWTGSAAVGGAAGMTGYGIGSRAREATLDFPGNSAYQAAHAGRRFHYQSRHRPRIGSGQRHRSTRHRMRAGSAMDID